MDIDLSGRNVLVAQQRPEGSDVLARFEQMRDKRVLQRAAARGFQDASAQSSTALDAQYARSPPRSQGAHDGIHPKQLDFERIR